MTTGKGGNTAPPLQPSLECCMCGDYGLSNELFRCKACQFRSQHRYCSNLYPRAESYRVCNWCLSQKEYETAEKTHNSCNSSSSSYKNREDDMIKTKKKNSSSNNHGNLNIKKGSLKLQPNSPIKKQRSPPSELRLPPSSTRRRIVTGGGSDQKRLRRTKSEDISKTEIIKQRFRNKVRRYKLLDEVSNR
ncbi:unnamed protein product [Ilex paraguariensis]|uniref:PHD-type zinc finger plants domain-containing protein n=1 Tax=Ilex paraguariensis TaxID=185542 RepID=A0ABC8T2X9_9AQUA